MTATRSNLSLFAQTLNLTLDDQGSGQPYLLLHGGAGPASMAGLASSLAQSGRAIVPTYPGFNGTLRPDRFSRVEDLVLALLQLLDELQLESTVLVGNSFGGWLAAEMALRQSPRIGSIVLLNAVGIDTGSPERQIVDPMGVPPQRLAGLAFHDPARYARPPADADAAATMAANQAALRVYAGQPFMHDPSLHGRLAGLKVPACVMWGESDGIVDLAYGQRFAAAMPGAQFLPVAAAGHFPQIEQTAQVVAALHALAGR